MLNLFKKYYDTILMETCRILTYLYLYFHCNIVYFANWFGFTFYKFLSRYYK